MMQSCVSYKYKLEQIRMSLRTLRTELFFSFEQLQMEDGGFSSTAPEPQL